jgi:TRAP-type uncharacterized transport system fused permease subunit
MPAGNGYGLPLFMAEFLGVPYAEVVIAANHPRTPFLSGCLLDVDFEAARLGLKGLKRKNCQSCGKFLKAGYLLIQVLVLILFHVNC